jgi:hypothetical protein
VKANKEMKINSVSTGKAFVELTYREICTISNALNEVCNGIHLEGEFDTRMGCSVDEPRRLLDSVSKLYESLVRR